MTYLKEYGKLILGGIYLLLILMCIVVTVTIIQLVVAKELLIKDIFNSISSMILLLMIKNLVNLKGF